MAKFNIIHFDFANNEYEILVTSFGEYKRLGGGRDYLDLYSKIKEDAKLHERNYISLMDRALSGIEVSDSKINHEGLCAQALWHLLSIMFNKPRREVSYRNFHLEEFNKL